ncbi:HPP family protein [Nocardia sp. 004]|uniref:CBS domain-containing protein n=1 Tax=Nocardia sp. 004 TaxID=3385978 RepID=UPI00399F4BA9
MRISADSYRMTAPVSVTLGIRPLCSDQPVTTTAVRRHPPDHRIHGVISMHARDVLSRPVVTVRPETPLRETITLLTTHGFAALPVVDATERSPSAGSSPILVNSELSPLRLVLRTVCATRRQWTTPRLCPIADRLPCHGIRTEGTTRAAAHANRRTPAEELSLASAATKHRTSWT